jgi:hypothetical protein
MVHIGTNILWIWCLAIRLTVLLLRLSISRLCLAIWVMRLVGLLLSIRRWYLWLQMSRYIVSYCDSK